MQSRTMTDIVNHRSTALERSVQILLGVGAGGGGGWSGGEGGLKSILRAHKSRP